MKRVDRTIFKKHTSAWLSDDWIYRFSNKLEYQKAFVYLFRRFGTPSVGDEYRTLGDWQLKSKNTDLIMDVHISYLVNINFYCSKKSAREIVKKYNKALEEWRIAWNDWCIEQGVWTEKDVANIAEIVKK